MSRDPVGMGTRCGRPARDDDMAKNEVSDEELGGGRWPPPGGREAGGESRFRAFYHTRWLDFYSRRAFNSIGIS